MTARPGQLTFDLGHRTALGRDDFLVAPCNSDAVAWIDRWPDWPGPALVIYGPAGCGKTHLARVWQQRSGATDESVIEDADRASDDAALFHRFNRHAEDGGHLLVTARIAPARWTGRLPDLVSRLAAAPTVAIGAPDDTLIAQVLVKLFADRQLDVDAGVVTYAVRRMERSFAAARRLVAAADQAALAAKRPVTVALVRAVLEQAEREND
jgi:chromosomal replication initiation ATPase DnaA